MQAVLQLGFASVSLYIGSVILGQTFSYHLDEYPKTKKEQALLILTGSLSTFGILGTVYALRGIFNEWFFFSFFDVKMISKIMI